MHFTFPIGIASAFFRNSEARFDVSAMTRTLSNAYSFSSQAQNLNIYLTTELFKTPTLIQSSYVTNHEHSDRALIARPVHVSSQIAAHLT
jgi:hypothetical protein